MGNTPNRGRLIVTFAVFPPLVQSVQIPLYTMPPEMDSAYSRVHAWLRKSRRHTEYRTCMWKDDGAKAVAKASPKHAAFYFDSLFPTHFFKAYHVLRSEESGVGGQLLQWLRFNPNLAVLDLGCGDGAGSCAVIATVLDFRLRELLDPRPLQIHIVAVDVDSFGTSKSTNRLSPHSPRRSQGRTSRCRLRSYGNASTKPEVRSSPG